MNERYYDISDSQLHEKARELFNERVVLLGRLAFIVAEIEQITEEMRGRNEHQRIGRLHQPQPRLERLERNQEGC